MIQKPSIWERQPQYPTGLSYLAKQLGVISCVYPCGGYLWDAARLRFVVETTNGGAAGGLSLSPGVSGQAIVGSNAGGTDVYDCGIYSSYPLNSLTNAVTVFALVDRIGNAGGTAPILGIFSPSTSPYSSGSLADNWGGGSILFDCSLGGIYVSVNGGAGSFQNGLHSYTGVYNGATMAVYRDGLQLNSSAASGTIGYPSDAHAAVMNYASGSLSRTPNARFFMGFIANTALPVSLLTQLHVNPWQLFAPIKRKILLRVAAAAGGLAANPIYGGGAASNPLWGYVV